MKPGTLLALNWKMNKTPTEARAWAEELREKYAPAEGVELAVMAPALDLSALAANLPAGVAFGGQDVSAHELGAYTGEISAGMLKDTARLMWSWATPNADPCSVTPTPSSRASCWRRWMRV